MKEGDIVLAKEIPGLPGEEGVVGIVFYASDEGAAITLHLLDGRRSVWADGAWAVYKKDVRVLSPQETMKFHKMKQRVVSLLVL